MRSWRSCPCAHAKVKAEVPFQMFGQKGRLGSFAPRVSYILPDSLDSQAKVCMTDCPRVELWVPSSFFWWLITQIESELRPCLPVVT